MADAFLTNEMAKRFAAASVPESGNLEAGLALITTGTGLQAEPKLVQFQDPLMVRYVGDQPGDYATFAEAVASLPTGVDDLSNANKWYTIYLRELTTNHTYIAGAITINVHSLHICGLPESGPDAKVILTAANDTSLAATFGIKFGYTGTVISARLMWTNMFFGSTSNYGIPVDSGSEFNVLEIDTPNITSVRLTFNNSRFYFRVANALAEVMVPKIIRGIYSKAGTTNIILSGNNKFSLDRYFRISGTDQGTYVFYESTGYSAIYYYSSVNEFGYQSNDSTLVLTALQGAGWNPLVMFKLKSNIGSTAYSLLLASVTCYAEYQYTAGVINKSPVTFFELDAMQPIRYWISKLDITVGSTSPSNIIDLSDLLIFKVGFNGVSVGYVIIDNAVVKVTTGIAVSGTPYFIKCVNGEFIITASSLEGFQCASYGLAKIYITGESSRGQITSDNIRRDESQIFATASRTNGKQFISQQVLPPVAPQPGDLWIETTEQY